ncbi:MAG: hydroxyethylthiazole kinase [Bacteroides sp.]|nr:hydroxyethylthiazole kinase [Bacteroides sp.]
MEDHIKEHLQKVRQLSPLVHSITNYVVMNNTANALLAIGASPIMAHAEEEIDEMVALCGATVINIGTLDRFTIPAMVEAIRKGNELGKPIILDPVGAGATTFRNEALRSILEAGTPQFIRGNASEIMALSGSRSNTKGVDSADSSLAGRQAARSLAEEYGCIVCVSGETDIITDGEKEIWIHNGSPLMTKVTGLGCTATALLAAFVAVSDNPLTAAVSATALIAICGEIAAAKCQGPGTLQLHLYDTLYAITGDELVSRLRMEVVS